MVSNYWRGFYVVEMYSRVIDLMFKWFQVFDREGDVDGKSVSVTVKAIDSGEPSLEGVCSFTVEITDVNDNPPLFDRQKYIENVKQVKNYNNVLIISWKSQSKKSSKIFF